MPIPTAWSQTGLAGGEYRGRGDWGYGSAGLTRAVLESEQDVLRSIDDEYLRGMEATAKAAKLQPARPGAAAPMTAGEQAEFEREQVLKMLEVQARIAEQREKDEAAMAREVEQSRRAYGTTGMGTERAYGVEELRERGRVGGEERERAKLAEYGQAQREAAALDAQISELKKVPRTSDVDTALRGAVQRRIALQAVLDEIAGVGVVKPNVWSVGPTSPPPPVEAPAPLPPFQSDEAELRAFAAGR